MNFYKFAQRTVDLPDAKIDFMMNYGARYKDVISLGQGTPLFPTPPFIYEYLYRQSQKNGDIGKYASPEIRNRLLTLIAQQMEKIYGFKPSDSELFLTVGATGGLFSAALAFLEIGDEAIFFTPSYPLHLSQIHLAQGKPVFVPLQEENNWRPDLNKLEKAINSKTKLVIVTNPNNPTGTVWDESEVRQLAEIILKHKLVLLLDEAYEFLSYDKKLFSPLKIKKLRPHIILTKSFSKEFSMTGWRIGYTYADQKIIEKIGQVHRPFAVCPPTPSMIAVIGAMTDKRGEKATKDFAKKFTQSREAICQRLDKLPKLFAYQKPQGAFYVFPKVLHFKMSALDFAKKLVDEAGVITIPGDSMGPTGKNHLRMSFACSPEVIHQAFDRFDKFAQKYKLL